MIRYFAPLALSFATGAIMAGGTATYVARSHAPVAHSKPRTSAIISHADQADFPVIVIGDSTVELAHLGQVCGMEALNAGLAGGSIEQVDDVARALLPGRHPKLIVIAAGLNDAHWDSTDDQTSFVRSYRDLIRLSRATGARVVAMNIYPTGGPEFENAKLFAVDKIKALNSTIAKLGIPVVDLWSAMTADGTTLRRGFTKDGVHPSPLGYRAWKAALQQSCAAT